MGRIFLALAGLIFLALVGLAGFAYLGDLAPPQSQVTKPVVLPPVPNAD